MVERVNVKKEPSIEDLESDTKHILEQQVKEITEEIEQISKIINEKLENLRLGVLQKTINKVIQKAFDERIDKITSGMKTRFSLELRKVIIEKFFASELGNLEEAITSDIKNKDYVAADAKWAKVKVMLTQIQDTSVKMQWKVFENEYLSKKEAFKKDQGEIKQKMKVYIDHIKTDVSNQDFRNAESIREEITEIIARSIDVQLKETWRVFEDDYLLQKQGHDALEKSHTLNEKFAFNESLDLIQRTSMVLRGKGLDEIVTKLSDRMKLTFKLQREHNSRVQKLLIYETKYNENYNKDYLNAALGYCEKILAIAEKIRSEEKYELYSKRKEQIEKRIAYQKKFGEDETRELLQKAQSIGQLMGMEDGVLPLVDGFAIGDLIGTLSSDMNIAMGQIAGLLKEHRVKIKNELDTSVLLKSESGEIFEEQISKEIQRSEDEDQLDVMYNVQTGLSNPFDESIEEALLKDLIPYNFEIMNVHVNGKLIDNLPEKQLTKDGMVLEWEFEDIPTKEKVEVVYDLRRRVSRTILFYLNHELRVIKTHSKLVSTDVEGVYHASMPFVNNYEIDILGVVVEDIIPLYYAYFVQQPTDTDPSEISVSRNGDLLKWEVGTLPVGTKDYKYKLLELYKYEELKIKMSGLTSSLMDSLHAGKLNEVTKKNSEIDQTLNLLSD